MAGGRVTPGWKACWPNFFSHPSWWPPHTPITPQWRFYRKTEHILGCFCGTRPVDPSLSNSRLGKNFTPTLVATTCALGRKHTIRHNSITTSAMALGDPSYCSTRPCPPKKITPIPPKGRVTLILASQDPQKRCHPHTLSS